jgi:hypothetical protein
MKVYHTTRRNTPEDRRFQSVVCLFFDVQKGWPGQRTLFEINQSMNVICTAKIKNCVLFIGKRSS